MIECASITCLCDIVFAGFFIMTSLGLFSFKLPLIPGRIEMCSKEGYKELREGETGKIDLTSYKVFLLKGKNE